jgi:hypothetical protein
MSHLDFWGWVEVFSYIINLWVFAIPWTIFGFLCILVNIFVNIDYNKGWAEGNVFLMGTTMYAMIQYTLTLPLIFEDKQWLRHAKFIRLISLMSAWVFNIIYFSYAWKLWTIYQGFASDAENIEPTYFEVFVAMVIVYNLIIHATIMPINTTIIVKEFSMEYYQFLGVADLTGTDSDDVSLGFHEVYELGLALL